MKQISIFIRADAERAGEYVEALSPLLDALDCELVIVGEEDPDVGRRHSLVAYSGPYEGFAPFCLGSAAADAVMIVEAGVRIPAALSERVAAFVREEPHRNLACAVKSYLASDGSRTFERREVLVARQGVRGLSVDCGAVLEDFGFLRAEEGAIADGVEKLMGAERWRELATWYEGFVLALPEDMQEAFRDALERYRAFHEPPDTRELDDRLISADGAGAYARYLGLRRLVMDGGATDGEIAGLIKELPGSAAWSYRGWLTRALLLTPGRGLRLLAALNEKTLEAQLHQLAERDPEASDHIHRFLAVARETDMGADERAAYARIAEAYLDHLQAHTNGQEAIRRLVRVTGWLAGIGSGAWLSALAAAKALDGAGKGEEAVAALEEACRAFPHRAGALRHAVQKLRFERGIFSHVLSICMIVKNEEKNLDRCLKSLKPLTDAGLAELIVVDTGSTDRSAQIARAYTGNVFAHPWSGNFSEARNDSIMRANGEFILIMDADEEIGAEDIGKLARWFREGECRQYETCTLRLVSYTDERHETYAVMAQPRVFRNTGLFCYASAVHNQPVCVTPATSLPVDVIHYGYIMTEDVREAKFRRTATMLRRELVKNPNHLYYRYQLSTSYAMYGDMKEAARQVDLYLRLIRREPLVYDIVLMYFNNAASIYINCHRYDDVEKISDAALRIRPDYIDFLYYKACVLFARERYEEALPYIDGYLALIGTFHTLDLAKDGRFAFYTVGCLDDVRQMFIVSNCRTGREARAIPMASALSDDAELRNCLYDVVGACFRAARFRDLARLYEERVAKSADPHIGAVFAHFARAFHARADEGARAACAEAFGNALPFEPAPEGAECPFFEESLVGKFSFDGVDFEALLPFFGEAGKGIVFFDVGGCDDPPELCRMKRLAAILLHRTQGLLDSIFTPADVVGVYCKYMEICAKLTNQGKIELLAGRERSFVSKMLTALERIGAGRFGEAEEDMRDAAMDYHAMDGFLRFAIGALIPGRADRAPDMTEVGGPVSRESLKAKIARAGSALSPDELLGLLSGDGAEEDWDAELYALKSAALLMRNRADEAEACLDEAERRFPMCRALLLNRYGLCTARGDPEGATRAYAGLRMLDPAGERKLPPPPRPPRGGELRVLHGTMDLTPRTARLVRALRDRGISARSLNYAAQAAPPYPDFALDVNAIDAGGEILAVTAEIAAEMIASYDVFHFHSGTTLTFNHFDLVALRDLGKKAVMHYWRRDVGPAEKLRSLARYIRYCVACDGGVGDRLRDWFEVVRIVRPMIDLNLVKPAYGGARRDVFTIVHAPTERERKGTEHVLKAVDALSGRYAIDFKFVQGMPREKAMRLYRDADLIVDQLLDGSYGMLAVEGMALGKPVVCHIGDEMREKYPAALPLISAEPGNLTETIESLIRNREMLPEIGAKGRAYVGEYHDMEKEIGKLIALYEE